MNKRSFFRIFGIAFLSIILFLSTLFIYWFTRPNSSRQAKELAIETWEIVNDGKHNAFTDLIYWKGLFYLAYTASDYHSGSIESKIVIMTSPDAKKWVTNSLLDGEGNDIRDPKFTVIKDRLFVYCLKYAGFFAFPTLSVYSYTIDGISWSEIKNIDLNKWLIWRPKTCDGKTWYAPFYWYDFGESYLMKSNNGIDWSVVSRIYRGDNNNETELAFLNDTTMVIAGRMEASDNFFEYPEGFTVIFKSSYPFKNWTNYKKNYITRLDGPNLFTYRGNVYAIGRYQPESCFLTQYFSSIFNKKRTSIFLIKNNELIYLSDILSGGDTSYPGSVIIGDSLYFSYYTSSVTNDYPWFLGMFKSTSIRIGHINLDKLEKFAQSK